MPGWKGQSGAEHLRCVQTLLEYETNFSLSHFHLVAQVRGSPTASHARLDVTLRHQRTLEGQTRPVTLNRFLANILLFYFVCFSFIYLTAGAALSDVLQAL